MLRQFAFAKLIAVMLLVFGAAAHAQEAQPSAALTHGAERVVALLRGEAEPDAVLSTAFLAQIPAAQFTAVAGQIQGQYGAVQRLERIEPQSDLAGVIHVAYERAILRMNLAVEAAAPHLVTGLLVAGVDER